MASKRTVIILACQDCKNKNYHYTTMKRKDYKVEVKKFCRACKKHTPHKETKSSS